jgi:glycosyltransferase involved in cell wall biosynthesis
MSTPRITVGMPVYNGAELAPKALQCLQQQTFGNFEVIISVDGNDVETAAACRPFLADRRFRMVVQPERLDWVGNFNWLLQQDLKEFFCYRQHDDTTSPDFFEILLRVTDREPHAAAVYCDCKDVRGGADLEIVHSIKGEQSLERIFEFIARLPNIGPPVPLRGLIRSAAIRQGGLVRRDEFRAAWQVFGWLARLLEWGHFSRVAEPLYYRLDHGRSYTRQHWDKVHRAAWTTLFTAVLEAAMQSCRTAEQRQFFQQAIVDRIVAYTQFQGNTEGMMTEFLERLQHEGNTHLLDMQDFTSVPRNFHGRVGKFKRTSRLRRALFQIQQRYELAKLVYPESPIQRFRYQVRHFLAMVEKWRSVA